MNKFSEYLIVKIGIIVAGGYVMLNVYFITSAVVVFVVATLISLALWLAVWDFAATKDLPTYKRRMIFMIHVAASVTPPAVGVFYITYMAGGTT